jgi:tetratricopeptide (TPR) repeat protein
MSTRTAKSEGLPRSLVTAVLVMTLVVLGLGGAVLAIKLRPEPTPTTTIERNLQAWERAVVANPKDDGARVAYGLALLDAGRTADARDAFEEALKLNAHNWAALFQLGRMATDSDPKRAVTLLAQAAKYAPATAKAGPLVAEGDLLMEAGDAAGARDAYRRAVADVPYLFDAHLGLAKALEALGDTAGALKEYQEAARFDPSNQEIAQAIARLKSKN